MVNHSVLTILTNRGQESTEPSADPTLGTAGKKNKKKSAPSAYSFLHSAIDGHSCVAYSEILTDEKGATVPGSSERANAFYRSRGVTVLRVLSDNGACYRSGALDAVLGEATHKFTRPYRP